MKRKMVSLLLMIGLLISLFPQITSPAFANGTCGSNLTWSFDSESGVLTIEGYGAMTDFPMTGNGWDTSWPDTPWPRGHIQTVNLPEGLTHIGNNAFRECHEMTNVAIPDSVASIGESSFMDSGLTSVTIPDSVTSIGIDAFYYCTGLTSVTLGNGVTSIAENMFYGCGRLSSVVIPESVTSIGWNAFYGCASLTSVTIGSGLTSIGGYAFSGCTGLTSVHISDLAAWCGISLYDGSSSPLRYAHELWMNDAPITDLVIPEGVTSIGNLAFWNCTGLTSVSIPDSVTSIGSSAFSGCTGLTSVTIPDSVTSISSSAFSDCTGLTSVSIPDSVTSIGSSAFSDCTGLASVTIPSSVTSIGGSAFSGCTGLKNITVPNSVASIGTGAFSGISKITVETTSVASSWFQNYSTLKELVIGAQVRTIGNNAFSGCSSLSKVTMKEGVSTIGDQAFSGCTHLTSLTIPASVTSIGSNVFENCTYLHELQLDVAEVSRAALDCCYAQLSDVTITDPECLIEYDANTLGVPGQTVIHGPENSTAQKYANHFGYQFEIYEPKPQVTFGDVSETAYYAEPVAWAVDNGITNGTGEGTFSPNNTCTRAQVVTFLWRAKGCPEPTSTENPFADVSGSAYYYKAVLWAKETGVTAGTSADKFSPGNGCTRAQVVTFLWRAEGEPAPISTSNPFTDVAADKYYTNAVLWAVEKEITKGTAADQFSPNATCTRGQIVTFLYRDMEG